MNELTIKLTEFLTSIGLEIRFVPVPSQTFRPGLKIEKGTLLIDVNQLAYPGDILHEAGHLACMPPEIRETMDDNLEQNDLHQGGEMMAIAWSYAACLYLGIDPAVVFHEDGYKGESQTILDNFSKGRYFGIPLLHWCGMTDAYPIMRSWTCKTRPT